MEYVQDQVAKLLEMGYIRDQVAKFYEMYFEEEEVYHDALSHPIGFDEYFGPSPPEAAPVDPRNWELYWLSHPGDPLDEPERQSTSQPGDLPELEFPKEDQPQGLLDVVAKDQHLEVSTGKPDRTMSVSEDEPESEADIPEVSGGHSDAAAEDLRNSIAKLNNILETETSATESPAGSTEDATTTTTEAAPLPPSPLANLRTFLTTTPALFKRRISGLRFPTLKLPEVRLPTLRLPILKLPVLAVTVEGSPQGAETATPAKEPEPRHYARTPLATYARVKSRLQDRPPLVAAFADHVSELNPSFFMPKQTSDVEVPKGQLPKAWNKLLDNLGDLLPTPLASLINTNTPRKRSLASILGGHTAKRVFAEVEHDPLDDSMIPQYQKWKKIKNKKLHNAQWSCLIIACILLICAIHIQKLREIKWWKFEFWQWLALGFVGLAGRLISGWGIKVSWHARFNLLAFFYMNMHIDR